MSGDPVLFVVLKPRASEDVKRVIVALARLSDEDPGAGVKPVLQGTDWFRLYGQSELHLDLIVAWIRQKHGVNLEVGAPCIAYRQTIGKKVRQEDKVIQRVNGRGEYAHCVLEIEPLPRGAGFEFINGLAPGHIPERFITAVERGVRQVADQERPIVDLRTILVDASFHEVDSSEIGFHIAAGRALQAGFKKADPTILEPIMACEVTTAEKNMGAVVSDLKARRAENMTLDVVDRGGGERCVSARCTAPLSLLLGYHRALLEIAEHNASATIRLDHWREDDDPSDGGAGLPVAPMTPTPRFPGQAGKEFPR